MHSATRFVTGASVIVHLTDRPDAGTRRTVINHANSPAHNWCPDGDADKTRGDCKKFIKYTSVPSSTAPTVSSIDRNRRRRARGSPSPGLRRAGVPASRRSRDTNRRPPYMRLCHGVSPPFPCAASISSVSCGRACLNFRAASRARVCTSCLAPFSHGETDVTSDIRRPRQVLHSSFETP